MIYSSNPSKKFIVDSAVAELLNDFYRIAFSNGFYPKVISVIHDKNSRFIFNAHFQIASLPNYEFLRLLNNRFNEVHIKVYHEADVHIEIFDDSMPF